MRCPYQVSRLIYKADSRIEIISYESVVPIRSPHFSDRLLNYWHRETNRTTLSYRIWKQNYFNQVSQTENNNYEWIVPIWCRYINEKESAYLTPGDQLTNWYPEDMQSKLTAGNLKVRSKKSIMDHLSLSGIIMSKKKSNNWFMKTNRKTNTNKKSKQEQNLNKRQSDWKHQSWISCPYLASSQ